MTREEAIAMLKSKMDGSVDTSYEWAEALRMAIEALKADRPTGEWIEHKWAEEDDGLLISNYECTNCHSWERNNTDFCPNCRADMRGKIK